MEYFKFLNNKNVVCLEKIELESIFEKAKGKKIIQEMIKNNITFEGLRHDRRKMLKITETVAAELSKNKDEVEMFLAFDTLLDFYPKGSEVCFYIKQGFNPSERQITNLADLKNIIEESFLTDFIIKSLNEFRSFQLKRYRNELETDNLLSFIKTKLQYYGSDLGDVNLLIVLQSQINNVLKVNFNNLHEKLKSLNLKSKGQILILYNENVRSTVINQVYPDLTTSNVPIRESVQKLWGRIQSKTKT